MVISYLFSFVFFSNAIGCSLDSLPPQVFEEIKFYQLQSLKHFDASESIAQNRFISNLLYHSRSLTSLNLKSCTGLLDSAFTSLPIHCPLEDLDLSVDFDLTDATLEALSQLANTLKVLKIRGPNKITNQGNFYFTTTHAKDKPRRSHFFINRTDFFLSSGQESIGQLAKVNRVGCQVH